MKESKVVPQIIEATGGKHRMFSSKWYTYSIYYTPSAKYPEVYVHPCTKSTRLHEIPRSASHQGWSSRFLVTIGQGDSWDFVCCISRDSFLRWVVHGGAQDVNGNVCGSFSNLFNFGSFWKITKVMRFGLHNIIDIYQHKSLAYRSV